MNEEAQDNGNDVVTEQKEIASTNNAYVEAFVEKLMQSDAKHQKLGKTLKQAGR